MKKLLCFLGFHRWKNLEKTEQNIFMTLMHDSCERCGSEDFYFCNQHGRVELTKSHYRDLMKTYGRRPKGMNW